MSQKSISSSQSKSDCSTYKKRFKRSNRTKTELAAQINSDQEADPDFINNLLRDLYNDSNESTKTTVLRNKSKSLLENSAILNNFKPFEFEKTLSMADHISVQKLSSNETNIFPETHGFVTCTNLSLVNNKTQCYFINNSEKTGQDDSFIITESEMIQCCHQAEKKLEKNESNEHDCTLTELTPKKMDNMLLVNSILEDFFQSPLSTKQIKTNLPCQCTPEFRLRRLPVKSYNRKGKKSTRVNLTHLFEEPDTAHLSEYDDISYCSSLSIQEDDTFCEKINNQSNATTLNNTERLCENLLNLTEYFTQNELKQSFEADQKPIDNTNSSWKSDDICSNLHKISDLLDSIITLRSKYSNLLHNDSYDPTDDFYGFANSEYTIDNHIVEQCSVTANLNLAPELACSIRRSNNNRNNEDNTLLDEWNEDDCQAIFACIDIKNILQQDNIHIRTNNWNNVVADDTTFEYTNNNQTFIVPNTPPVTAGGQTTNCDNKSLGKDENIFENHEEYEWNDDCDLFLNFQTPIPTKENIVANTQQKLLTFEFPHLGQDAVSTSKSAKLGFTTAAGKNVHITSKGQATVRKLLTEFAGEINNNKNYEEELREMKFKVYAKSHNLKTALSPLSVKNQYNNNQNLKNALFSISTEQRSKNFEKDISAGSYQTFEQEFKLTTMETKRPESQIQISPNTSNAVAQKDILECKQQTNKTLINKLKSKSGEISYKTENTKLKLLEKSGDITDEEILANIELTRNPLNFEKSSNKMDYYGIGFQTANGKQVAVSKKAKQIAETLLEDFNTNLDIEKDLKDIKTKVQIKNHHYIKNFRDPAELLPSDQRNMSKGFQTAHGKEISISAKAKKAVESLLNEFNNDLDIETCEIDIKDFKAKLRNKTEEKCNHLDEDSIKPSPHEKQKITNDLNSNINVGLKKANGKYVSTSTKTKQAVEIFFKNFNTPVDVETSEKYLKDEKTKIQNKTKDLLAKSIDQTHTKDSSTLKLNDNLSPKLTNFKRKFSIDNSDLETTDKTNTIKIFKNDLQSSQPLLAEQSPLTATTRSITARKNLLSLSKKRKNKGNMLNKPMEEASEINKDLNELNLCRSTPTKSDILLKSKEPASGTPNLKEFSSNASLTSTPRVNKILNASQTLEDSDLKPIIWKNDSSVCNKSEYNSSYATKLTENSTSNISFNSPKPTAKERIGRLKMYGKAPDVSPILIETNHNCRPSGLRRTRSMLKKSEN